MRNSRLTPRTNTFMRKAMGITSKVMIFGILLSLFLFACVGVNTLAEVAEAATLGYRTGSVIEADYYSSTNNLTKHGGIADGVGVNFTELPSATSDQQYVLNKGDTDNGDGAVDDGWSSTSSGTDYTIGWYVSLTDAAYYKMLAGKVSSTSTVVSAQEWNHNVIKVSFHHNNDNGVASDTRADSDSKTYSSSRGMWGTFVNTGDVSITGWRRQEGIYSFYTQLYVDVASGAALKVELMDDYGISVKFKSESSDGDAPELDNALGPYINVRDSGDGLSSVKVTDPSGKVCTFMPASRNADGHYKVENQTEFDNIAISKSTGLAPEFYAQTSSTAGDYIGGVPNHSKNFRFYATQTGTYTLVLTDLCGEQTTVTHTVSAGDLNLVSTETGETHTIAGAINVAGQNLIVPSSVADEFNNEGFEIGGWTATNNATIVANGLAAIYQANVIGDVTLTANWQKILFKLRYHNNLASDSTVIRYADRDNVSEAAIIDSADYLLFAQGSVPMAPWSGFVKPGYYLAGWSTSSGENNVKEYGVQDVLDISSYENTSAPIDLYAVWKPLSFTVTYNGNGSTVGTMETATVEYGDTINIPAQNRVYKQDSAFSNWTFSVTGSTYSAATNLALSSADKTAIFNALTSAQNNVVEPVAPNFTLTANWSALSLEFGINWDANGSQWGSEANPYVIRNQTQFDTFKGIVNGTTSTIKGSITGSTYASITNPVATEKTYAGAYFLLDANVSSSTMIGSDSLLFAGNFNGNGKTITFTYSNSSKNYVGIFAHTAQTATIRNLNVSATVVGAYQVGAIVGRNEGAVSNCTVTGTVKGSQNTGGIVGYNTTGIIDNCVNRATLSVNSTSTNGYNVGGIAGINTKGTITNSTNYGSISGNHEIGGIVGKNESAISSNTNQGNVTGNTVNVGGIAGYNIAAISDCIVTGVTVKATTDYAGGIAGFSNAAITNCTVSSTTVTGNYRIGGIAGQADGAVANCHVQGGSVTGNNEYIGGVVGYSRNIISGSSNTAPVKGTNYVGGITGYNNEDTGIAGTATVVNCYNGGSVTGSGTVGGVVGWNKGIIQYAANKGAVSGSSSTGGIVGNYESGTIEYVFDFTARSIVGANHASVVIKGWTFVTSAKTSNTNDKDGHYVVLLNNIAGTNFANVKPMIGEDKGLDWMDITTVNFNGFYVDNIDTRDNYLTILAEGSAVTPSRRVDEIDAESGLYETTLEFHNLPNVANALVKDLTISFVALEFGIDWDKSVNGTVQWGTESNPYIIRSQTHLDNLAKIVGGTLTASSSMVDSTYASITNPVATTITYAGAYFLLEANISFASIIGSEATPFAGNFNGNNKTITFSYNASTTSYIGVFGFVTVGGVVRNLNVSANIVGYHRVGGIVAHNDGTITNCTVSGNITAKDRTGGIAGYNRGTIQGCSSSATVSGNDYTGGIVGMNTNDATVEVGIVENCYNTGSVNGAGTIGGIVGDNMAVVRYCVNNGSVSGSSYTGGVVGRNKTNKNDGTVNYVFDIKSGHQGVGGNSVGNVAKAWTIVTSDKTGKADTGYFIVNKLGVTIKPMSADGRGDDWSAITTNDFTGFYFDGLSSQQDKYLSLVTNGGAYVAPSNTISNNGQLEIEYQNLSEIAGDIVMSWVVLEFGIDLTSNAQWGSVDNPYLISSTTHLDNLSKIIAGTMNAIGSVNNVGVYNQTNPAAQDTTYVGSYFRLDINLSYSTIIGSQSKVFAGNFDGNGKTITFTYSNSSANYIGLFANIGAGGNIHHLNVSANIVGSYRVGGIAGENAGTISYCTVSGTVTGSQNAGGIVGYNTTGVIDNCTNNAQVTVVSNSNYKNNIGGIAGLNQNGTIQNCTNNATVNGSTQIGGIVGKNESIIKSSTNTAAVSGSEYIGGIAGENKVTIQDCHVSIGSATISGTGNYVGGITSKNDGIVSDCTFSGKVSGTYRVSGIVAENTGTITGCDVISGTISGLQFTAGIAGYNDEGTIVDCTNAATISGTYYVGGIAGNNTILENSTTGVVERFGTILRCSNTGSVTGSNNYVGGIVGVSEGTISGCSNTGTVKGVDYIGGITGKNDGKNKDDSNVGYLTNCYNSGAISGSGAVAGIAGENVTKGLVQYCYNSGAVTVSSGGANSNIGSIVGNNNYGENRYVFNAYDGRAIIGGNHSSTAIIGWTFTTNETKAGKGTANDGYYVINKLGVEILPTSEDGRATDWSAITTTDFTGFYIGGLTLTNGQYLSLLAGDTFATPSDALTTPNVSTGDLEIDYVEYSNVGFFSKDIIMTIDELRSENYGTDEIVKTFDGRELADFGMVGLANGYSVGDPVIVSSHSDTINATAENDPVRVLAQAKASGCEAVLGVKLYSVTINQLSLNSENAVILYQGKTSGANKVSVDINGTSTSVYDVTKGGIIDYNQASVDGGIFYLAVKIGEEYNLLYSFTYNPDSLTTMTITKLVALDNGAVTAEGSSDYDTTDKMGEGTIKFSGIGSGNYTGEHITNYILIGTDFGRLSTADPTDPWGSEANPYVISDWTHLIRLSDIVNGVSEPIDSVLGYGIANNVMAEDIFFTSFEDSGDIISCYFLIQGNIEKPTGIDGIVFRPIGGEYLTNAKLDVNNNPVYISYFGGIVDGKYQSQSSVIDLGNLLENYTGDYSGLFGLVKGTEKASAIIKNIKVNATTINGNNFVGSLVGKAEEYVLIDYSDAGTEYVNTANVNGNNYVGGFVGYVGLSVRMLGAFDNSGQVTAEGNYIGGIIGQLVAGAGTKATGSNTYNFGAELSLVNSGKVMALVNEANKGNYVGGIIGGTIENTGDYSALETIINIDIMQNFASVAGTNYVGGLIGEVSPSVALHIRNALNNNGLSAGGDDWTHNGSLTSNGDSTISATADAVGGLVGKLSLMGHQLVGVFNTMPVIGGGQNVGGLVGVMDGGTITNSFVSIPGTDVVTSSTNLVSGGSNVGGLVGMINTGTLTDNFVQGFNYGTVSATRGGVVGVAQAVANINNSWALYITGTKDSVTYRTASSNSYGKYVLTYSASTATIGEMLVYAGLIDNSTIAGNSDYIEASSNTVIMEKGKVSFGLALPAVGDQGDADSKDQLTFYDGSGYETPFPNAFDGAANDSTDDAKMLYVRLSKDSTSSLIIAATRVNFGTVANYESTTAWENAYFNIGEVGLYVADVTSATVVNSNYQPIYKIQYKYDLVSEYVYVSVEITKSYGKESSVAPLVIASEDDWIKFANRVKGADGETRTDFDGKTVKLAADITVSTMAGTTNGNDYFAGTFDGDGYTIKFDINAGYSAGYSLFPSARNATFKNLTVTGEVQNPGGNSAGFVGRAYGSLTFENCTNKVVFLKTVDGTFRALTQAEKDGSYTGKRYRIDSGRNTKWSDDKYVRDDGGDYGFFSNGSGYSIAGFIGTTAVGSDTASGRVYTFIGCVNQGHISVYDRVGDLSNSDVLNGTASSSSYARNPETHGVGGFIGTVWNGNQKITYSDQDDGGDGEPYYEFTDVCSTTPVVKMESCRNAGNICGSYNVGGLIGYNGGSTEIMNCGNTGIVEAICEGKNVSEEQKVSLNSRSYMLTEKGYKHFRKGYIRRYANAGGLVGLSTSRGHVDMYTSYNSGIIHGWGNNAGGLIGSDIEYTKKDRIKKDGSVISSSSIAQTKIYYCYNVGDVYSGADRYVILKGEGDDDGDSTKAYAYTRSASADEYAQNANHWYMSIRYEKDVDKNAQREGGSFGAQVGGIIGATTNTSIGYCYNIGTITCRGLALYSHGTGLSLGYAYAENHARAGGLVGFVDNGTFNVKYSYNVGDIRIEARHYETGLFGLENIFTQLKNLQSIRPMYVAGIVGHDNAHSTPSVTDCYSLMWQCHYLNHKNKWERYHIEGYNPVGQLIEDWKTDHLKFKMGNPLPVKDEYSSSGHIMPNVSYFTGITNSNGIVTMPDGTTYDAADPAQLNLKDGNGNYYTKSYTVPAVHILNHANAGGQSDIRTLTKSYSDIKAGGTSGWIYMPGCLPQLAVFALDTQDGLAMTSVGYGRNSQGEFVQQPAGSELNPYVIKDGIDLLGLSSLVSAGAYGAYYDTSNKYIEFANGTNNLSGAITESIQMPQNAANYSPEHDDHGRISDYVYNGGSRGKSYHLYDRAANGLHNGQKTNANSNASQDSTVHATSFNGTSQNTESTISKGTNTYDLWAAQHHGYNGSSYTAGVMFNNHNFNPIGYRGTIGSNDNATMAFKGNISGLLPNGKQVQIYDLESRGGYITVSDGSKETYAGLFGLVQNATISNITVTGNITAYGSESGVTSQAGIVAKAYGNTTITGLQAGVESDPDSPPIDDTLDVESVSGDNGYVGGIVGMADSGATGNRLIITGCETVNANISSHVSSVGGIIGYTQGDDVSSFTDVVGCKVTKATISADGGKFVGGIVGNQGANGALSVNNSQVGTYGKTGSNVVIQGVLGIGGIIAYADASATCTNSFTNCYVHSDVLIQRTAYDADDDGKDDKYDNDTRYGYGTAIGGIVGVITNNNNGYVTFSGIVSFQGTIDLDESNGEINISAEDAARNVGGVVGYMGTTARMEQCLVNIGGKIIDCGDNASNIGGFAGISKGVCLDGMFLVYPTLDTAGADNVGGFIGYNDGNTYITRTAIVYTTYIDEGSWDADGDGVIEREEIVPGSIGGQIVANENVGGFIGANAEGMELHLGTDEYAGTIYGTDEDKANIVLGSTVDGKVNVGGMLGYNGGKIFGEYCTVTNRGAVGGASGGTIEAPVQYVGGVVGFIDNSGSMEIGSATTIENNGQVGNSEYKTSYQQYVGGIIGASYGSINVNSTSLANMGSVYGYQYVGGAIGMIGAGTITGTLNNGQPCTEHEFADIDSDSLCDTCRKIEDDCTEHEFVDGDSDSDCDICGNPRGFTENESSVAISSAYAEDSEALVAGDIIYLAELGGASVIAVQSVGGVIGVVMQGATIDGTVMNNYGTVTADSDNSGASVDSINYVSNLGGVIGLHYGVIKSSSFSNFGNITAENFAGGAIGVSDGLIDGSEFINYAPITFKGDTALGGSVGYITKGYKDYYPDVASEYVDNKNKSAISGTYFSYEPQSRQGYAEEKVVVQATGERPYGGGAVEGGLGGVFGIIDSTDITSSNWAGNTFFINGDVYGGTFANGTDFTQENFTGTVSNVGGVVGVIDGAYVTIDNMLVYHSNVGGATNVGGIIGSNGSTNTTSGATASIYNCYNVYGEVIAKSTSGIGYAGGIVGAYEGGAKTYASYWIKEYANEHLQNSNPDDIANTLDSASEWNLFLTYKDYVSNNDNATDGNVDPDIDTITDEMLAEAEVTSIEEYLALTGHLGNEYPTWNDFFNANAQYVQNANGDWGTYDEVTVRYNTGTEATGYYYIFANDGEDFSNGSIEVDHTDSDNQLTSPYSDETLNFWLIIANSPKQIVKEHASDNVSTYAHSGKVIPGVIYSTAYTANVNGFYLYVKSTEQIATQMYAEGEKMYISSNAETAGNVMIFYKEYTSAEDLEYNGFYRYATANRDLTFVEESDKSSITSDNHVGGTNYLTLTGTDRAKYVNEGKVVGSYHTKADIWTLDSNGNQVTLGTVDSTLDGAKDQYKWKIKEKQVTVEFIGGQYDVNDEKYDGTYSHYATLEASGIALDEADAWKGWVAEVQTKVMNMIKIQVNYKDSIITPDGNKMTVAYDTSIIGADGTSNPNHIAEDPGADILIVAYSVGQLDGAVTGINTIDSGKLSESHFFKMVYRIYAKKAGTYEVSAVASDPNHTTQTQGKTKIQIGRRDLDLDFTVSDGGSLKESYVFDGGAEWRGVQMVTIENISPSDLANISAITEMFTVAFNLDSDNVKNTQQEPEFTYNSSTGTATLKFFASDVGAYNPVLNLTEGGVNDFAGSYRFTSNDGCGTISPSGDDGQTMWEASWTITPYTITVGSVKVESKTVVYNGQTHSVAYSAADGGSVNDRETVGNETINIMVNITVGEGLAEAVNVGTYPVEVVQIDGKKFTGRVDRNGSKATAENPIDNYTLEGSVQSDGNISLTITPREVKLLWNGTPQSSFVYTGDEQGLSASDVILQMKNDDGQWVTVGSTSINGSTLSVAGLLEHKKPLGGTVSETLAFSISDFTAINAGNYTATITNRIASATGENDAGQTLTSNYELDSVPAGHKYTISPSRIMVTYDSVTQSDKNNKVFDNTTTVLANLPGYTITSTNGGAVPGANAIKEVSKDYSRNGSLQRNVGTGYDFTVKYELASGFTSNYVLVDSNDNEISVGTTILSANAKITPKGITIILYTTNGTNTIFKVFDNDNIYATVDSSGNNTVSSTGNQFRPGRGITVEGFLTSGVTVTAKFQEMEDDRSDFGKYVNNVAIDNSGNYYMSSGHYKQIYIVLDNNGGGSQMNNYYIAEVTNRGGDVLVTGATDTTRAIRVPDSRAQDSVTEGKNVHIAITPMAIKVNYANTVQSYANPDNTYNTDWEEVYCSNTKIPSSWGWDSDDLSVTIKNGWMYANGVSGAMKRYNQYTRIAGKSNSSNLGATLTSDKGYNFCLTLRNQPTLIIGYFVEKPDGYEIGTMAGLLIATEYYKGNFNPDGSQGYDYVQTTINVKDIDSSYDSWEELLADNPDFDITTTDFYRDLQSQLTTATDPAWKEAVQSMIDSIELVYEAVGDQQSPELQYVYWKAEEIVETQEFKSFYLINNLDGILTASDMEMINGAFGTNWGAGKSFLKNVIFAEEGSMVIFNGSVFDYIIDENGAKQGFDGQFNGMGYIIDHLTISHNVTGAGEHNIGMFAEVIGLESKVTALGFRNLSINVIDNTGANTTINVGAVAGKYAASGAENILKDITVHGTISVKSKAGTVYVGGVIGSDNTGYVEGGVSSVLEGAIVVATIRAEGSTAVAGGIVGVMNQYKTSLTDLVSLSEVYAKGATAYANGFVGKYFGLVGSNLEMVDGITYTPISTKTVDDNNVSSAFMDAIFTINEEGVYTKVDGYQTAYRNKYVKSYTALYDGSVSAFDNSGKYTTPVTTNNYGLYDVVSEKDVFAGTNTTGTRRLKDIVDIYVLGYGLTKTSATVNGASIDTFAKSNTSKYFHATGAPSESPTYKPDGTADNPIKIAYQQHLSLIRMFNYMNFELKDDITMYTGYELAQVDEAFTGTITANGKKINVRSAEVTSGGNAVMFAYQPQTFTWLIVDEEA